MLQVRRCQDAQAFKWIKWANKDGQEEDKLEPCSPGDEACIKMSLMELASNKEYGVCVCAYVCVYVYTYVFMYICMCIYHIYNIYIWVSK